MAYNSENKKYKRSLYVLISDIESSDSFAELTEIETLIQYYTEKLIQNQRYYLRSDAYQKRIREKTRKVVRDYEENHGITPKGAIQKNYTERFNEDYEEYESETLKAKKKCKKAKKNKDKKSKKNKVKVSE